MNRVFLALGSNKGDRESYLLDAVHELNNCKMIKIIAFSSVYETKPYGDIPQENYLNAMVLVETDFKPDEIYYLVKKIEAVVGRTKSVRWGAREIDIDIILIGDKIICTEQITVPHKEYDKRDFVLAPLCEIDPGLKDPNDGEELVSKLNRLEERYILRKTEFTLNYLGELN